jgi:SAM-dependent methyltransferase
VSEYFADMAEISIYECEATGYRFYHPFSLVGKEGLYQQLQQFEWNYKHKKWEYDQAVNAIPRGSKVLDVGCGEGAFLALAEQNGLIAHGLELNSVAADKARESRLNVSVQLVGEHADQYTEQYDAVCSFQVLEHVPGVHAFITDCIRCLRPGGQLIFGVPNNDGFLKHADTVLNAPPHHMGLWTERSLTALPSIFDLKITAIECEPLAEVDWYLAVLEGRCLKGRLLKAFYHKSRLRSLARLVVASSRSKIRGHTILAFYEKRLLSAKLSPR